LSADSHKRFSVRGTALAAGVLLLFQEQLPVASAIPLTNSTPSDKPSVVMEQKPDQQTPAIIAPFRTQGCTVAQFRVQ